MMKELWMAVTADKYELPLAVEETSTALAKAMKTNKNAIYANMSRYRRGVVKGSTRGRKSHFGEKYFVVKVEESAEEDADERNNDPSK